MRLFRLDLGKSRRTLLLVALYASIIAGSFYTAYELRFDFVVPEPYQQERLRLVVFVIGIKLIALVAVRQLGSVISYFSLPDLVRILWAMTTGSALLIFPRWIGWMTFAPPRGVLLTDFLICLAGVCAFRLTARVYRERMTAGGSSAPHRSERIAIVGAGDAGASLAKDFLNSPRRGFKPVAFFDDNRSKHGERIHGIPILGRPELIADEKQMHDIDKIVIAMPSAPARRIREIVLLAAQVDLKVETLPSLEELASGRVKASRIRPVEVQDLLGRDAVDLDSSAIRKLVEGKIVMVTGAGGSIGSELCRQIASLNPQRVLMVEQSEGSLFLIEQELNETALGAVVLPLVGDILDEKRMEFIFSRYRPAIVFHAAAHKHVYMMERQPSEAVRNNVIGTRLLSRLAVRHGAEAFILISTDKAVNPTSVMGATKRLAEIQLQLLQTKTPWEATKLMAVRFGNVLGSSGSVIPIFKRQIVNGGPVTVTHPEVTRYFMTIPEAVGLVLQSTVLGSGGEIFVLNMGQPVKIADLARQMIELSGFRVGEDIEIVFTGLKPGEKLFEELQQGTEQHTPTEHSKIMRFTAETDPGMQIDAAIQELETQLYKLDPNQVKVALRWLVPEYTPHMD